MKESTPIFYFDNSIVRPLIANPENWNRIYDVLTPIFGLDIRPVQSIYLLLEFLGITKERLGIKSDSFSALYPTFASDKINGRKAAENKIDEIGAKLDKLLKDIQNKIIAMLNTPEIKELFKEEIQKRIVNRNKLIFASSSELLDGLFKDSVDLFYDDYPQFINQVALHLAWDCFCSMQFDSDIKLLLLREIQLGIGLQLCKKQSLAHASWKNY